MRPHRRHREHHKSSRAGWLRAAVLGSNDAIVSTASLMMGVAAAATGFVLGQTEQHHRLTHGGDVQPDDVSAQGRDQQD